MSFEEDLKISPFNPIETNQTATRAPSIGRFAPNFTQSLIRPYHTIMNIYVIITQYFVKIFKIVCFQHNKQEFVILYFGQFSGYQNSFNYIFVRRVYRCHMQSLVQIGQIVQQEFERVGFSLFAILQMESYCKSGRGLH